MMSEVINFTSNKPYLFRAILDWLLDNDSTPYILVDATKANVDVPQEHIKDDQIVLNISPTAVQNWYVDKKAISFSARFSGRSRDIYVPMPALLAVYAQENGQGMAFPVQESDLEQDEAHIDPMFEARDNEFSSSELKQSHSDSSKSDSSKSDLKGSNSQPSVKLKAFSGEGGQKATKKPDPKNDKASDNSKSHLSVVK